MESNDDSYVGDEIISRLEDLYGDSGESPDYVRERELPEDFPLRDLQATVLSIDWEITDQIMTALIDETRRLEHVYEEDRYLVVFLRLLGEAGKYIRSNKANSHPDAIRLLNAVYNSLERVFLSEGINEKEKKEILLVHVKELKALKEKIAKTKAHERAAKPPEKKKPPAQEPKAAKPPEKKKPPVQEPKAAVAAEGKGLPDMSGMPAHEAFMFAIEEIKEVIRAEFRTLRTELKLWRGGE
jgi:hypothetical protein